jgi:hypothetical protein
MTRHCRRAGAETFAPDRIANNTDGLRNAPLYLSRHLAILRHHAIFINNTT